MVGAVAAAPTARSSSAPVSFLMTSPFDHWTRPLDARRWADLPRVHGGCQPRPLVGGAARGAARVCVGGADADRGGGEVDVPPAERDEFAAAQRGEGDTCAAARWTRPTSR